MVSVTLLTGTTSVLQATNVTAENTAINTNRISDDFLILSPRLRISPIRLLSMSVF